MMIKFLSTLLVAQTAAASEFSLRRNLQQCKTMPSYTDTYKGLPAKYFETNQNCQELGYSFGYKMEGCTDVTPTSLFSDKLVKTTGTCTSGVTSGAALGSFNLRCSSSGGEFKDAIITTTVDAAVIMKGGNGGTIYNGLKAGTTYTIDIGPARRGISHIEFCFMCDTCTTAPAPVASPASSPAPTLAPTTKAPVASPASSPAPGPPTSDLVCTVDHDAAQSKHMEIKAKTASNTAGTGWFGLQVYKNQFPYTTPTLDMTLPAFCLDFERVISLKVEYSMDVYSLVDDDLPSGVMADGSVNVGLRAVDKPQFRKAVSYVLNKKYIGTKWVPKEGFACNPPAALINGRAQPAGTPYTIRWQEVQLALWRLIDDVNTETQKFVTGQHCIAQWIAEDAMANGMNYEVNCLNPTEVVPIAFLVDAVEGGNIQNQVIITPYPVTEIEGMCTCNTRRPTEPPTPVPTLAPTEPPTPVPTLAPTKAPVVPPTSPPAPDQPPAGDRNGPPTYVKGDPHFKTFGGEMYDFHGECDLVLLHNPEFNDGQGMDVHIRTKIADFWSSVESAAIRLGEEIMEINANPESDEWLWVNGEVVSSGLEIGKWYTTTVGGFLIRYKESSASVREANIYIKGAVERMVFKTFKSFVRVDVDWETDPDNYMGSVGLLGSFDKLGMRVARDGVTTIDDTNEFGQEWQVGESDPELFHSKVGAVVGRKCVMPPAYTPETAARMKRRLRASNMTQEDAEKACDHLQDPEEIKACIFDVIATQDLSMASAW